MKKFLVAALAVCVSLIACANPDYVNKKEKPESQPMECSVFFKNIETCGVIRWTNPPSTSEKGQFVLELVNLTDAVKEELSEVELKAVLWMPSMGHGSAPTSVVDLGDGKYEVNDVHFIMSGDWEIRFALQNKKGILDEAVYSLEL